ncbi:MAG: DUF1467 family protein [Pseudomonadota bacterium]
MSIFTGVIVYLMIFWTALFVVLPWGNHKAEEYETGMAGSAPKNPRIKQKFIATAILSAIIWGIVAFLIHIEVIDFYAISQEMFAEDLKEE